MDSSNNDSFGSFGVSGGTGGSGGGVIASGSDSGAAMPTGVPAGISSGGPVVIGGGMQEKKGKKWIVVAVLLVVCVGVGLAVFALLKNQSGGNSNSSTIAKSFNSYANYLLEGKESSDSADSYRGLSYSYYFDKENINLALNEAESDSIVAYYDKLSEKLGDFLNAVDAEEKVDDKKRELVQEYFGVARAYFDMRSKYFLNGEDIKRYYAKNGYDATKKFIENYYAAMDENLEEVKHLKEYLLSTAEYYLNEFNAYSALGCVDGIEIKYDCSGDAVVFEHNASIIELEAAIETVMDVARGRTLEGYWEIYDEIIK